MVMWGDLFLSPSKKDAKDQDGTIASLASKTKDNVVQPEDSVGKASTKTGLLEEELIGCDGPNEDFNREFPNKEHQASISDDNLSISSGGPEEVNNFEDRTNARQDNANHIFMLQAQIQTLYRQMDERMSSAPTFDAVNLQEAFEARVKAWMDDSDRKLNAHVESELASFRSELRSMQSHQHREIAEIHQFISHQFDMMERKIQQCIAITKESERAQKQKKSDASAERLEQLEAKVEHIEGAFDHVEELRRQVTSQQKLLQSCQRHLREILRDRDEEKQQKVYEVNQGCNKPASEPPQQHPSSITSTAKTRFSEKHQQSLRFRDTLNHLKFMTEGGGQKLSASRGVRETNSSGKKFRDTNSEKRNPAN